MDSMYEALPHLSPNFSRSVFPCATFNFGPNVWTIPHRDSLNCAFGWCAIQALGDFDSTLGGHIILWDLKLVIEFPSGSTILIPSATITHSNIQIRAGESRSSFTQYCAGGILRWVDNGFQTENELQQRDPEGYEKMMNLKDHRWKKGLEMYSTLDELHS
jgi:hypothetical protein